ncbi:hypothetical protein Glove_144g132 [Diversispora epigaea]|uniref:Uncharacterized protein n=1 Tax=Diversispora epigaea TaxID=1348612 RepID=A0A397IY81_9GLOM|nr:hypothetical protein Glove_144g132 [Diversispora epigaea]
MASQQQLKQQFKQLPKNVQKKLHRINIDGTKLVKECDQNSNPEARENLKSIVMEIDFIHLDFNESEGEKLKIARELLRPYRNKFIRALAIFKPKQEGTKRKRISGDGGNKRARRQ